MQHVASGRSQCGAGGGGGGGGEPAAAGHPRVRTRRVVLDSRDRDVAAHPHASKYEVRLEDELFDVVSAKLLVADLPFSAYMVSDRNRAVPLRMGPAVGPAVGPAAGPGAAAAALLDVGDYTDVGDFASAVADVLAAAAGAAGSPGSTFSVVHVPRTDSFVVCGSDPFELAFRGASDSAAALLGFSTRADYASAPAAAPLSAAHPHELRAPYRRNFEPDRYLVLTLTPSAELLVSVNNATDRSFAVLPRRAQDLGLLVDSAAFEKTWSTPLARLAKLGVEITDYAGRPYDFQNQEHRLEILFTCLVGRKYALAG